MTGMRFLTALKAGSLRSKCWQGRCLLGSLSLACRKISSTPFTWPFLCACLYPNPLFSYKHQLHWIEPNPVTSINFNYFFEDPDSKDSHILRYCGLGLEHINLLGGGWQPQFSHNNQLSAGFSWRTWQLVEVTDRCRDARETTLPWLSSAPQPFSRLLVLQTDSESKPCHVQSWRSIGFAHSLHDIISVAEHAWLWDWLADKSSDLSQLCKI